MPLKDTIYCVQQIHIPPELPDILKQFTKAAIRAQPQDLLLWSAEYFSSLVEKKSSQALVEKTLQEPESVMLTPALLKTLHIQLSPRETCSKEVLQEQWQSLCLNAGQLETLLSLGDFSSNVDWMQFVTLGCGMLAGSIHMALAIACEILTEDTEAETARIPVDTAIGLYTYLARVDGDILQEDMDSFLQDLQNQAAGQEGMVQPSNFINLEATSPPAAEDDPDLSSKDGLEQN